MKYNFNKETNRSGTNSTKWQTIRNIVLPQVLPGIIAAVVLGASRAFVDSEDLETIVPEPTEEELVAFHEANPALFTAPETKAITYAWLTGLFFMFGLFWLDYLGILRLSTQNALALSVVVLALSAVIYQSYLFRKGDVG